MSLKKMSYTTAQNIIDIYSQLLVNKGKSSDFAVWGYSDLKGYTIFDVDNALKIIIAYSAFNLKEEDQTALAKLRTYCSNASAATFAFFDAFVPDEIIPEIEKLDRSDKYSLPKFIDLKGYFEDNELYKIYKHKETHDSFLNYCLHITKNDENYWEKIYDNLELVWDARDYKDPITIIINNKSSFFK